MFSCGEKNEDDITKQNTSSKVNDINVKDTIAKDTIVKDPWYDLVNIHGIDTSYPYNNIPDSLSWDYPNWNYEVEE